MQIGHHIQYANKNSSRNDGVVVAIEGNTATIRRWIGPSQRFHSETIEVQVKAFVRTQPWISRVIGTPKGKMAA